MGQDTMECLIENKETLIPESMWLSYQVVPTSVDPLARGQIYKITNTLNGKSYIGMTKGLGIKRWKTHLYSASNYSKSAIHRAIHKYGREVFIIEIIASGIHDWEELGQLEFEKIREFGTITPNGYNLCEGGYGAPGAKWSIEARIAVSLRVKSMYEDRPELREQYSKRLKERWATNKEFRERTTAAASRSRVPLTEEQCFLRSQRMMGNQHLLGYHPTEETRKKISMTGRGRKRSVEACRNISAAKMGALNPQFGKPSPRRGVKLTDETKQKLSLARKLHIAKKKGLICCNCGIILDENETNWAWSDEIAKIAECDSCFEQRLEAYDPIECR
jgi:group I intron endonuclease